MTDDGPDVTRSMRWDEHAEASAEANGRRRYPRPEPPSMRELHRSVARLRLALAVVALVAALLALAYGPGPW